MRTLFAFLVLFSLTGAGCTWFQDKPVSPVVSPEFTNTYQDKDFGFSFRYPNSIEVRPRDRENWPFTYVGLSTDFFLSVRDTVREEKPVSILYMYALKGGTVDQFTKALTEFPPGSALEGVEDVMLGEIAAKKVRTMTEVGQEKVHYLFERNGSLIIASVFLGEDEAVRSFLKTLK